MDVLDAALSNLRSPAVIAFVLGVVGTMLRSDLRLPEQVAKAITVYLLLSIGIKGGVSLSETTVGDVAGPAAGTLLLGLATPVGAYLVARRFCRFLVVDAAALAAHYGSVSLVTFAGSIAFLEARGMDPEGFMPALLALLEIPAIVVALVLAKARDRNGQAGPIGRTIAHVLPEPSVLLLVGGLAIGWIGGKDGWTQVEPFFGDLFRGILTLFLLQMGCVAAAHLKDLRDAGARLVVFAVVVPIANGTLGAVMGRAVGLSLPGATVLACMAASASYIAAPAAVSMALPKANPGYYLPAAIGVTFPFNIALGIPLYYAVAELLY